MATGVLSSIKPLLVAPSAKHSATVIFLHGLGDSGAGWLPVAEMIKNKLPHVKWVLPNAPNRSVTINMGMEMPAWFDLLSLDEKGGEDQRGMLESARTIDKHIQDEIDAGIPPERIVVGGFSQGACLSLLAGLTERGQGSKKLGGVVVLSGWLPLRNEFRKMASPHLTNIPILMCHGTADPVVPYKWGEQTRDFFMNNLRLPALESKPGSGGLRFKGYNSLGHSSCAEEIQDLVQFLQLVLPRED